MDPCRLAALLALLALALLLLSCGGDSRAMEEPAEASSEPSPIATRPPEPTASGPGSVRVTLEASCRLGEYSAEMDLDYRARGEGTTQVSRVRLLINGRTELDTGFMSEIDLWGSRTVRIVAGRRYTVQLLADSPGAAVASANSTVRCPAAPDELRL